MPRVRDMREFPNRRIPSTATNLAYVGRPTKWGNPFKTPPMPRTHAINAYREWMKTSKRGMYLSSLAKSELKGKDLVCWCAPQPCHADVLIEIANE